MTSLKYAFLLIAAMPIIGCSTAQNQTDKAQVNLAGYPPAFQDGYADGCDSARRAIGKIRDENRFETDSMYAAGWRDGYDICSEKKYD